MALPTDPVEREKRLVGFGDDIRKLADYLSENHPNELVEGMEAVDIAIRILSRISRYGNRHNEFKEVQS